MALISIHPEYVEKILCGSKRLEFRRQWTTKRVESLVVYATAPVQKIVAVLQLSRIHQADRNGLWELAQELGGGVSQQKLFDYMAGKPSGYALEWSDMIAFSEGLDPQQLFGDNFYPPQSFRYLTESEREKIEQELPLNN